MKTFHCDKCGQQVFFENTFCERCGSMLGYLPADGRMAGFAPAGLLWRRIDADDARLYRQCRNYAQEQVCNWMIEAGCPQEYCASCRLTRTIPDLQKPQNRVYWERMESAKRRLLYSLWQLHLLPDAKQGDTGSSSSLAFAFLEDTLEQRVMSGHDNGLITLNIAEADPARREQARENLHEPYRTLLGHFRHESGHYYFDRLIAGSPRENGFRQLFGDERQDYAACLNRHYRNGPPPDWNRRYISAYASAHPWEDWAETWAHYLHLFDTLDTAHHCGMSLRPHIAGEPELTTGKQAPIDRSFDAIMHDWFALSYVLNSLNRSIGMPDAYPFTLSTPVLHKLRFIHELIHMDA